MRKPDILSVLVIAVLAGVVVTMFFQGVQPINEVQAQDSYSITAQGWGQVRPTE